MAWRKARRGEGETAVAAPTSGKKKKAARKSTTAADPTEEELQALEDQAAAEAGEDGDDDGEEVWEMRVNDEHAVTPFPGSGRSSHTCITAGLLPLPASRRHGAVG